MRAEPIGAVPLKTPPGVLGAIVERTLADVRRRAADTPGPRPDPARPFAQALRRPGLSLIAEYKPRSPSRGAIRPDARPEDIARAYLPHAAAISCLVDGPYFGGSYAALRRVRETAPQPVLAKGFFVTEFQVREAASHGADAILLMASLLPPASLESLLNLASTLGLDALIEVHDAAELAEVLPLGAAVIGVNSRDLTTLEIDLDHARRLLTKVPADRVRVAESGLDTLEDIDRVRDRADGVLIGTAFMRAPDPGGRIVELGLGRRSFATKICGLRRREDADACIAAGADFAGINLARRFRRSVDVETARPLVAALRGSSVIPVGVFMDQPTDEVARIADAAGLEWIQLHGEESLDDCATLARRFHVIKALDDRTAHRAPDYAPQVAAFLLDGRSPGSGERWDPTRVALPLDGGLLAGRPVWLAGGLNPENVGPIARMASLSGVDVASGAERDGQLASDRIKDFVRAARAAREAQS